MGLGVLADSTALGGSRDEKWRAQWIRKRFVSWNLPKLSQLWRCNGGFGPCTAQNHLRKNNSWVVHEIPAEWLPVRCETKRPTGAIGRDCRACARNVCQEPSEVNMSSTCKVGQKLGLSLLCWHAPLRRDHPGYCTAGVGNPGGTYE